MFVGKTFHIHNFCIERHFNNILYSTLGFKNRQLYFSCSYRMNIIYMFKQIIKKNKKIGCLTII